MAEAAKKKGKGLMIGLILLVVFIAAGAVVGLAMTGKINIPGLTPKKKVIPPAAAKEKPKPVVPQKPEEPEAVTAKAPSPESIKQGAVKLAEIWNEMPSDKLSKVVEKWKPSDLAVVLNEMDPAKVADVLGTMKEQTASTVSQELRKVAALAPPE